MHIFIEKFGIIVESSNFFFYNFFYSCNNITTGLFVANTRLFVECLCVCGIFFILIFVFGCQESVEKMPRNTSPTVILLRAKWNFPSFNPRLLVNSSS